MSKEAMKLALKRAFQLGQDYWYQADHDSYRENKKSDETLAKFRQLVDETCEAMAAQQALDKMAENAREVGLDYEPAPATELREQEPVLQDIEQYRLQMAGISTAAIGYWKEGDGIHPDYDTVALRDVAKLYAKYDALYKAQPAQYGWTTERIAGMARLKEAQDKKLSQRTWVEVEQVKWEGDKLLAKLKEKNT